jgi:hypothetical protein
MVIFATFCPIFLDLVFELRPETVTVETHRFQPLPLPRSEMPHLPRTPISCTDSCAIFPPESPCSIHI